MRAFIRHPTDIPIQVVESTRPPNGKSSLRNLSLGGLAFISAKPHARGQLVRVSVPEIDAQFQATCRVVWCHTHPDGYEVGAQFMAGDDLFRLRMVEQVCHIEQYRRQIAAREGRHLSTNEAAQEWIREHAEDFPSQQSLGIDRH